MNSIKIEKEEWSFFRNEVEEAGEQLADMQIEQTTSQEQNGQNGEESNLFLAAAKQDNDKKKKRRGRNEQGIMEWMEGNSGDKKNETNKQQLQKEEGEDTVQSGPKAGKCDKCGEFFESRTRLFEHIRSSNTWNLERYLINRLGKFGQDLHFLFVHFPG